MCDKSAPVPPGPSPKSAPHVVVVSDDALLRELVAELLTNERFTVSEAGDVSEVRARCTEQAPSVVLLDAIVDGDLAWPVLSDPWSVFGAAQPALVVLAGAGTPREVREHERVDQVLPQPLTSELLVGVLRQQATWHPRRRIRSGARLRPDVQVPAAPAGGKKAN